MNVTKLSKKKKKILLNNNGYARRRHIVKLPVKKHFPPLKDSGSPEANWAEESQEPPSLDKLKILHLIKRKNMTVIRQQTTTGIYGGEELGDGFNFESGKMMLSLVKNGTEIVIGSSDEKIEAQNRDSFNYFATYVLIGYLGFILWLFKCFRWRRL